MQPEQWLPSFFFFFFSRECGRKGGQRRGPEGKEKERISSPLHAEPRAYVVLDLIALSSPPKPESWAGCLNQLRQPGAPDF